MVFQGVASPRPCLEFSLPRLGLELSASASPWIRTLLPCLASASTSLPWPLPLPRQNCLEPIPAYTWILFNWFIFHWLCVRPHHPQIFSGNIWGTNGATVCKPDASS